MLVCFLGVAQYRLTLMFIYVLIADGSVITGPDLEDTMREVLWALPLMAVGYAKRAISWMFLLAVVVVMATLEYKEGHTRVSVCGTVDTVTIDLANHLRVVHFTDGRTWRLSGEPQIPLSRGEEYIFPVWGASYNSRSRRPFFTLVGDVRPASPGECREGRAVS